MRAIETARIAWALCPLTLIGVNSCAPSAGVDVAVPGPAGRAHVEAAAAGAARAFGPIDSEVQLFDDELLKAIGGARAYPDVVWPRELPKKALPLTDVPADVLVRSTEAVKLMLKPEWVPKGLRDRWIPFRRTWSEMPLREVDVLGCRYQVDDVRIQIRGEGSGMAILIDPGGQARPAPSVEEYVVDMAPRFFTLPRLPRPPKFHVHSTRVLKDARRFVSASCYTVQGCVELKGIQRYLTLEEEELPPWWPCMSFLSDGHFLLVEAEESGLIQGGTHRHSQCSGPYPRFRGSKPFFPKGPPSVDTEPGAQAGPEPARGELE